MSQPLGVSIIIPNYNYARFVGEAIESSLAQTHPEVEVIVVDDGSTDQSRIVIGRYAGRITSIFQANAGHLNACATGFAAARHDIVVFLDSDDVLLPHAAATIVDNWQPSLAKLQFRLETVDADTRRQGFFWPKYPTAMAPEQLRDELLRTGAYTSPPTSGNAYARHLLEAAAPLEGHTWVDSLLNTIAPLYGDVRTIDANLALYRVHGGNNWSQEAITARRFAYYAESERRRMTVLVEHCSRLGIAFDGPEVIERSLFFREVELVCAKLGISGSSYGAGTARQGGRAIATALGQSGGGAHKHLRAGWSLAVMLAPRRLAEWLIAMRFVQAARPRLAEQLIATLGRRRGHAPAIASDSVGKASP